MSLVRDQIIIKGKKILPERKKYERDGCCPNCKSKNYTYVEIDREYHMLCHKCNYEVGVPYTDEAINNRLMCSASLDQAMQYESE